MKSLKLFVTTGCMGFLVGLTMAAAGTASAAEPIRIPLHNWTSQLVGAEIVGRILQQVGSEVEYVPADSGAVYEAMCEGDVDLVHEVWQGAFGVAFEKQVAKGCVIDAATHDAKTREEWWYPAYFEDVHLEGYGHSWGPYLQPIISGGRFFLTVPILPYKMGLYPPGECIYTLGHYRPGNCAPYMLDPLPLSVRAAVAQGGVWTGMVYAIP